LAKSAKDELMMSSPAGVATGFLRAVYETKTVCTRLARLTHSATVFVCCKR
jgi:hypothetical protein